MSTRTATRSSARPKVSPRVIWRRDGENNEMLILSKEGLALPLMLNPAAAQIFLLCNGRHSLNAIAKKVSSRFSSSNPRKVLRDVKKEVEYLNKEGIVKI